MIKLEITIQKHEDGRVDVVLPVPTLSADCQECYAAGMIHGAVLQLKGVAAKAEQVIPPSS